MLQISKRVKKYYKLLIFQYILSNVAWFTIAMATSGISISIGNTEKQVMLLSTVLLNFNNDE